MADVFDFDDDLDYQSDEFFTIERKKAPPVKPPPVKSPPKPAPAKENASTKQPSDDTSSSAPARPPAPVRTVCPVLKGSRHARMKAKRAAEEEERKKRMLAAEAKKKLETKTNNNHEKSSPDKHVHFSPTMQQQKEKKNGNGNGIHKQRNGENNDDDEEWSSSVTSSSVLSARQQQQQQSGSTKSTTTSTVTTKLTSIPPRRKRRRNNPATTSSIKAKANIIRAAKNTKGSSASASSSYSPPLPSEMMNESIAQSSLSDQIKKQLQQHERQQQKLVPSPTVEVVSRRRIKGAGGDAYDIQEAGQLQMLQDEITFLSSTILECPKAKIITNASVIDSVAELAVLLSSAKSRRMLWQAESNSQNSGGGRDSDSSLELVLDVLGYTTTALSEKPSMADRWSGLNSKLQLASPKKKAGKPASNNNNNNSEVVTILPPPQGQKQQDIVGAYYTGLLLDALSAIVSFLSWDATFENLASAFQKNATGARAFRRRILHHEGVLSAFMIICRESDPIVSNILGQVAKANAPSSGAAETNDNDSKAQSTAATSQSAKQIQPKNLSQSTDFSSAASASHEDADSEAMELPKGDPTVAGRRKRRRKRGGNALETIAEDGSIAASGARSPPRSPPRVVFKQPDGEDFNCDARTKLSFESEDALSPSREFLPTKRARYGRDDGSSMVSCDSGLLKIHDKLGKARLKFAPTDRALGQAGKDKHTCQSYRELPLSFGGKYPAGCASSIALKALSRLLTGKDEGDQQSCLQDDGDDDHNNSARQPDEFGSYHENDDGDPQLTEEDEGLGDNPLLQTNRIIENSGMIPSLACGMAETLSAIVEEVEHRDESRSNSCCAACLRHLHDKLQGLVPIVDNACLFHDDNRIELSTTKTAAMDDIPRPCGVLVGSQLLFLKLWLQRMEQQSKKGEKGSRTIMKLLTDTGVSVLRTLTSLTHENSYAADQLAIRFLDANGTGPVASKSHCWSGVEVLAHVLHWVIVNSSGDFTSNDACTLCLNTLANLVGDETYGGVRRLLAAMECPEANTVNGKGPVMFLGWLAKWVVGLTDSFRDSIMKGSFGGRNTAAGSDSGRHSGRELEQNENELLFTAGNGCVLLACLLMGPPKGGFDSSSENSQDDTESMKDVTRKIREVILSEMPVDESSGLSSGTLFIQNTLRAFSNYLYYSMGDLSVAVVTPVRRLISELDKIKVEVV